MLAGRSMMMTMRKQRARTRRSLVNGSADRPFSFVRIPLKLVSVANPRILVRPSKSRLTPGNLVIRASAASPPMMRNRIWLIC